MSRLLAALERFGRAEKAASLVEYSLLLALIVVVCIGAMTILGSKASVFFSSAATTI